MDEKEDLSLSDESVKIEDPSSVGLKAVGVTRSESSDGCCCCSSGW